MAIDVVRLQRSSFTAIYFNAGFEDSEKHLSVDVVEATQYSTENLPIDFIEAATSSGRANISAVNSSATQATASGSSYTDRLSIFSIKRL